MPTWIDWYTSGAAESLRRGVKTLDVLAAAENVSLPKDDWSAMRLMATAALDAVNDAIAQGRKCPEHSVFLASLMPFFATGEELRHEPAAFALTPEIVEVLAGAVGKQGVRDAAAGVLSKQGLVYLDLPHRSLMIGPQVQVRALLVSEGRDERPERITTILAKPGSNAGTRMAWHWGRNERDVLEPDYHEHGIGAALAEVGVAIRDVQERVEEFLALVLAYISTQDADETSRQTLPYIAPNDPRRRGRKASQVAKKFSLFRIRRLRAPADRFGRAMNGATGRTWQLDQRVTVIGHFKMQVCGPQRSQRRLTWIDAYERGPIMGRRRPELRRIGGDCAMIAASMAEDEAFRTDGNNCTDATAADAALSGAVLGAIARED